MLAYLLQRLMLFIPSLIIIALLGFIISENAPGDPLLRLLGDTGEYVEGRSQIEEQDYRLWAHRLGLDLPAFYLQVLPLSFPDTLHRIFNRREREAARYWMLRTGNKEAVEYYRKQLKAVLAMEAMPASDGGRMDTLADIRRMLRQRIRLLLASREAAETDSLLLQLDRLAESHPFLADRLQLLREAQAPLRQTTMRWKSFIPTVRFHLPNRFHRWLFGDGHWLTGRGAVNTRGVLRGDFGISLVTQRPVGEVIYSRMGWSLLFSVLSTLLAYLISVPAGVMAAVRRGKTFDHLSSVVLFAMNSMPSFWVGSVLILLFANPAVLMLFPASGVMPPGGYPQDAGLLQRMALTLPYLILPLITYTYSSLAFLSRITRLAMVESLGQDFVRTARAKGLPERLVIYRHAFRNSLLPLITVFSNVFPAAVSGAVVVEMVFSIPGMGLEAAMAVSKQDFPVVIAVFTVSGLFTMLGFLVSDLLYVLADPRIRYRKR